VLLANQYRLETLVVLEVLGTLVAQLLLHDPDTLEVLYLLGYLGNLEVL
jgi:hypothetical protein